MSLAQQCFEAGLSITERRVLMLRYSDQLSPAEIAVVLDLLDTEILVVLADLRRRAQVTRSRVGGGDD